MNKGNDSKEIFDVAIIGGGIQGMAIASEAARSGLRVFLCDKGDFGSATSCASSKLIHGGLRYLEHGAFSLVKESLQAQKLLQQRAPHLVHPLLFYIPYNKKMRAPWIIRLGLGLYDWIGGRRNLPSSKKIFFEQNLNENPLKPDFKFGFQYADCQAEDTRLVIANAKDAHLFGAVLKNYTACTGLNPLSQGWEVLLSTISPSTSTYLNHSSITARIVINATGPWVAQFLEQILPITEIPKVRLIKGSHIVVPKLYPGSHAYLLQNEIDQRIIFVIPYQNHYSLIGTTDIPFNGDIDKVRSSTEEEQYLLEIVRRYFRYTPALSDIVGRWAGIRALFDDGKNNPSAIGREYHIVSHHPAHPQWPPLFSIYGGKLTTHHKLATQVLEKIRPFFSTLNSHSPTPLPGGIFPAHNPTAYLIKLGERYPKLPKTLLTRYLNQYGTDLEKILGNCKNLEELGLSFGHDLYEKEIRYLLKEEWAKTAEDILWRRTRLGLSMTNAEVKILSEWLKTIAQ